MKTNSSNDKNTAATILTNILALEYRNAGIRPNVITVKNA
jgi:hypothetical protein